MQLNLTIEKKKIFSQTHNILTYFDPGKELWGKKGFKNIRDQQSIRAFMSFPLLYFPVSLSYSFILTLCSCFFGYLAYFSSFMLLLLGRFLKHFFITWINIEKLFSPRLPSRLQPSSVHLYIIH